MNFLDVVLVPKNSTSLTEKTRASSLLLTNLGSRFHQYVEGSKAENPSGSQEEVEVKMNCSHRAIQCIVSFAQNGTLALDTVSQSTREELLQLGLELSIPAVVKTCSDYILDNLRFQNATSSYMQVMATLCPQQQAPIRQFIMKNFVTIAAQDPRFSELIDCLDDILPDDKLNVKEEQLFQILSKLAVENSRDKDTITQVAELTKYVRCRHRNLRMW